MAKDGAMPQQTPPLKYRLGNQSTEYELITTYLGWIPNGYIDWEDFATKNMFKLSSERPREITLTSPDQKEKVELLMDHALVKDAFPLSFFGEERAENWWRFYKVSTKRDPRTQFVIPLH